MRNVNEIVKAMKIGWNLGNSLDSFEVSDRLGGETGWGNPATEKRMIDEIASVGFNLIRIPVTWFPYVNDEDHDTICPAHLARVKEVVDYAIANHMFVILNTHHENSWLIPQWEGYEKRKEKYCRIWEQIAECFKDYPDLLLFEALNEPRIEFGENEWGGCTQEVREVINALQAEFVKVIRSSGGNNQERCILITTAGASTASEALEGLAIPEDHHLLVSLHLYLPQKFCVAVDKEHDMTVWDGTDQYVLDQAFERIDQMLLKQEIPVIITEFGAAYKGNTKEIAKWTEYVLSRAARLGIKCLWWDNNYENVPGDSFAVFRRATCEWVRPEILTCLLKAR